MGCEVEKLGERVKKINSIDREWLLPAKESDVTPGSSSGHHFLFLHIILLQMQLFILVQKLFFCSNYRL